MSEQSKHNDLSPQAEPGQDLVTLIKKMQQQLVYLEKKIDLLIGQSQARPSGGDRPFSGSRRSGPPPHRRFDRARDNDSGEKRFDRGHRYEKRHDGETRGFGYKKRSYDSPREGDFGREHSFKKPYDGEKRGFDHKKKHFPYKHKDRG